MNLGDSREGARTSTSTASIRPLQLACGSAMTTHAQEEALLFAGRAIKTGRYVLLNDLNLVDKVGQSFQLPINLLENTSMEEALQRTREKKR